MRAALALAFLAAACGGGSSTNDAGGDDIDSGGPTIDADPTVCEGVDCSGHGTCFDADGEPLCQCDGGYVRATPTTCEPAVGPTISGCPVLPANHLFNTPIDALPVHPMSAQFITTIGGGTNIHLDLGTETNQADPEFYGIPWQIVNGSSFTWPAVVFASADGDLDWDPRPESDCAVTNAHTFTQPCTAGAAPSPLLPIPTGAIVEGGVDTGADHLPYGDHHILLLDADSCVLWETYHSYLTAGTWNIFGAAGFDLASNALRPDGWTSADAAGFPILPLLIRADEAATGEIKHALRFTIESDKIRTSYTWPARHLTNNGTASTSLPQMGQLFRLKASYTIPSGASTQTRAILTALKTYGVYLADGGSDMYIQGEPSATWDDAIFDEVQDVPASEFEAVDLTPITSSAGWDVDSGAVP
jgi:hypothetical protein